MCLELLSQGNPSFGSRRIWMNPFRRIGTQRSRHERLVHFLIENYAGNLTPLTRPEQVRVGSDPGTGPIKAKIVGEEKERVSQGPQEAKPKGEAVTRFWRASRSGESKII